jgi:hypothetical protein
MNEGKNMWSVSLRTKKHLSSCILRETDLAETEKSSVKDLI